MAKMDDNSSKGRADAPRPAADGAVHATADRAEGTRKRVGELGEESG